MRPCVEPSGVEPRVDFFLKFSKLLKGGSQSGKSHVSPEVSSVKKTREKNPKSRDDLGEILEKNPNWVFSADWVFLRFPCVLSGDHRQSQVGFFHELGFFLTLGFATALHPEFVPLPPGEDHARTHARTHSRTHARTHSRTHARTPLTTPQHDTPRDTANPHHWVHAIISRHINVEKKVENCSGFQPGKPGF